MIFNVLCKLHNEKSIMYVPFLYAFVLLLPVFLLNFFFSVTEMVSL